MRVTGHDNGVNKITKIFSVEEEKRGNGRINHGGTRLRQGYGAAGGKHGGKEEKSAFNIRA